MSQSVLTSNQPVANDDETAHGDLLSKFDDLIQMREGILATGQADPFSLVMEQVLSPTKAICNGRETILLGTYNYMGMTFDPDVVAAGKQALADFGTGTTGSRVLNGTYQGHKECEDALRDFYGMDHAMVFSTGYQANLGIISTLAGKGDYIVLDIDSHASIWDGCALGNAEVVPFKHNDIGRAGKTPETHSRRRGKAGDSGRRLFHARRCRAAEPTWSRSPRNTARWCWWTKRIRWASSARTDAAWRKKRA